jgi:hypothetical protein
MGVLEFLVDIPELRTSTIMLILYLVWNAISMDLHTIRTSELQPPRYSVFARDVTNHMMHDAGHCTVLLALSGSSWFCATATFQVECGCY